MDTNLSYSMGSGINTFHYATNVDLLQHWARTFPEKDAFIECKLNGEQNKLTFKELLESSTKLGKYLVSSGLRKGENVVICMNNSISMVIVIFGVSFAGGISIFTGTNMADGSDIIELVTETDASLLFIDTNYGDGSWKIVENVLIAKHKLKTMICNGKIDKQVRSKASCGILSLDGILADEVESQTTLPVVYPEDTATYFKTSGSTGNPKLVGHTHITWLNNARDVADAMGMSSKSIYFCDRPFGWAVGSVRTFLATGATRVFVDTRSTIEGGNISAICDIISSTGCTHLYLPGYLITDILARPELKEKFTNIDGVLYAGERFRMLYMPLVEQGFCKRLYIWYGSTEANGVSIFQSSELKQYEHGIIGTPSPGVEMKLIDKEGKTVVKGQIGELCVRSIYRFHEFKGNARAFGETVDMHGWLHTGDIGLQRPDGNFVLEGRSSEQISIGTVKIFPFDIEKVLVTCPGVDLVMAVPVPDMRLGNAICACVVVKNGSGLDTNDLSEFCDSKWTDGTSLKPKYIHVREVRCQLPVASCQFKFVNKELATGT